VNCDKAYIGGTGRKLGIRLHAHRMEVDSKTKRAFTRSQHTVSLSEHNESALTDHATHENHVIDWTKATVIDRETESKIVPPSGSRKLYISVMKVNKP